jgi:hypothetical protein
MGPAATAPPVTEGDTMHARVAVYRLVSGTGQDVGRIAQDGMLPIFREQPGFISYEGVASDDVVISISRWESAEGADAAISAAASFVRENLADRITLEQAYVGDVLFSSST